MKHEDFDVVGMVRSVLGIDRSRGDEFDCGFCSGTGHNGQGEDCFMCGGTGIKKEGSK